MGRRPVASTLQVWPVSELACAEPETRTLENSRSAATCHVRLTVSDKPWNLACVHKITRSLSGSPLATPYCVLVSNLLPSSANAQSSSVEAGSNTKESDQLYYTLGTRLKSNDMGDWQNTARVRPVIGLRYGKWQLGIGDGRAWRNLGQFGSEPTLSYQVMDEPDLNIACCF